MKLYFVRHGAASGPSMGGPGDELRPLTQSGRDRFATAARALVSAGVLDPEVIVTSPLVRARQTADLLSSALADKIPVIEEPRLRPGFDLDALSAILAEKRDLGSLAIVGHNPDFESVLSSVVGDAKLKVRKGTIALVDCPDVAEMRGTLDWLAPPALFGPRD